MAESPKRRKCKDNPYTLNYIEEKNIYTITFKDVKGHLNKVEVSEEVYRVFDKFELQDIKDRVFVLDCFQIARHTIRKAIPNTPMLGAFMKVSGMYELEYFKEKMVSVLKKLSPKIIEANMVAIQRAYDEVH